MHLRAHKADFVTAGSETRFVENPQGVRLLNAGGHDLQLQIDPEGYLKPCKIEQYRKCRKLLEQRESRRAKDNISLAAREKPGIKVSRHPKSW